MFCLPETGPVHPCSFFRLILRDKGQFVSEEGYLSNNETCKTKNLPLNVLSWLPAKSEALNRNTCLARASAGAAGGLRGRRTVCFHGGKIQEFSLLLSFMSLVNE